MFIFGSITIYITSPVTSAVCVILTTFFTGIMALGIWYTRRSLDEATKVRTISAWQTLLQAWGDSESRNARRYIFAKLKYSSLSAVTDKERNYIENTLASCNRISYMVLAKLIKDEDILYFIGPSMLQIWDTLKPYIKDRRQASQNIANSYRYMRFFEDFITKYRSVLANK